MIIGTEVKGIHAARAAAECEQEKPVRQVSSRMV